MLRVLVADDDAAFLRTVVGFLSDADASVAAAASGADALEKVRSGDFDVLLLDARVPDPGGLEVLARVRELRPDLPVVVAGAHPEEEAEALDRGAEAFVPKPLRREQLLRAFERARRMADLVAREREARRRAETFAARSHAVAETARELAGAGLDVEAVLATLCERVAQLLDGTAVVLLARGDQLATARFHDADPERHALAAEALDSLTLASDDPNPAAEAFRARRTVHWSEAPAGLEAELARRWPGSRAYLERVGLGSVVAVPLLSADGPMGTLACCRGRGAPRLGPDEREFVEKLGGVASLAIGNARLFGTLDRERAQFEAVLRQIPAGVAVTDGRGALLLANEQTARVIGGPPPPVAPAEWPLARSLAGEVVVDEEVEFERADGQRAVMRASSAPVRDREGRIVAGVVTMTDVTAARDARNALETAHETLDALVQASPLAIVLLDARGHVVLWNRSAERIFGWSSDEVVGSPFPALPEDRRDEFFATLQSVIGGARVDGVETVRLKKQGGRFDAVVWAAPVPRNGSTACLSIVADITERKALERDVAAHGRRARLLAEVTRAFADAGLDAERVLDTVVRRVAETFGGPATLRTLSSDGTRLVVVAYHHPDPERRELVGATRAVVLGRDQGFVGEALRTGRLVHVTDARAFAAAHRGWANYVDRFGIAGVACVPLTRGGRSLGVLVVARDGEGPPLAPADEALLEELADRAAAFLEAAWLHEELGETSRRLRFLSDASASLAESLDERTMLARVGSLALPDFAEWCLVDLADADGRLEAVARLPAPPSPVPVALDPGLDCGPPLVFRTGASEHVTSVPEGHFARALGFSSYVCVPVRTRERVLGTLTFAFSDPRRGHDRADRAMFEDLGRRAGTALENARLYAQLRREDEAKGAFLAMLAHELRNPLAPIVTATHVFRRGAGSERALEIIERQTQHLTRLVDDLLDVTRIARGKIELRRERVDLAALARATVEDHRATIERADVALEARIPGEPVLVDGDPTRLAQVIGNLLSNAGKFSDPGGVIALVLEVRGATAVLRCRDHGIGMTPEVLGSIFEPFVQADRSLARTRGGLGLGLAVVKGLVSLHGGTVRAASAGLGQGSELTVELPLAREALTATPAPAAPTRASSRRILIVEDNVDAADTLRELLEMLGHVATVAASGPEALARAPAFAPELVLCDIGLPGMDGYQLAPELRRLLPNARLIALSGYGAPEDRRRSSEVGFDVHLTKPVNVDALERALTISG